MGKKLYKYSVPVYVVAETEKGANSKLEGFLKEHFGMEDSSSQLIVNKEDMPIKQDCLVN